jgi:hypothetical protein
MDSVSCEVQPTEQPTLGPIEIVTETEETTTVVDEVTGEETEVTETVSTSTWET